MSELSPWQMRRAVLLLSGWKADLLLDMAANLLRCGKLVSPVTMPCPRARASQ